MPFNHFALSMSPISPVSQPADARTSLRTADAAAIQAAVTAPRMGGLDFLRAVAVSFVMWGHATEDRVSSVACLSGLGVKIFFVLSGFLITRLLLDEHAAQGRIDFLGFYRRRVARLMPGFYLFLAAGLAVLWLRHHPIPWMPILSSIFYVTNYYQAFTEAQTNLVAHCWSLAVEEQFYLLWPMALVLLLRRHVNLARALLFTVLAVCCWRWILVDVFDTSVYYLYRSLETRADQLLVGCLMAVLVRMPQWRDVLSRVVRVPGLGVALMAGLYFCAAWDGRTKAFDYGVAFAIEPPMIALLILMTVLVSNQRGWLAAIVNNRFLIHVGKISYGMYLFHGLVGFPVQRITEERTGSFTLGLIAAYAAVTLVSSASFRWFETPMRRWVSGSAARH